MPEILFLIPISFIAISLGLIVFIILNISNFTFKKLSLFFTILLISWLSIPLSVVFAQSKSEVNVKVTKNGKIMHQYKNVHSFNNKGNHVYSMTNRNNKSFKIFINDGQKIHISDPVTYHPNKK